MTRPFKHWESVAVRWGDQDAHGRVNDASFFVYCESARVSLYRAAGLVDFWKEGQEGPAVVSASLNFRKPLFHPATLDVGVRVGRIGKSSFTLEYGLFRAGTDEIISDGYSVVVWLDGTGTKARDVPERVKASLLQYCHM